MSSAPSVRTPDVITNLRTTPGGDRRRGLFDPRVKELWALLVNRVREDYAVELNLSETALALGVHRHTVRRWIDWMEEHKLLALESRRGGRGRGVVVHLTWVERGEQLAQRRRHAQNLAKTDHVRSQGKGVASETVPQRHKPTVPKDSQSRGALMERARIALTSRIRNPTSATQAVNVIGRMVWKENMAPRRVVEVLTAIEVTEHIPVPRWVMTARDAFRWAQGMVNKLLQHGCAWWVRLKRPVERVRLKRALAKVQVAIAREERCPICGEKHTRWAWREGVGHIGELRVALADLERRGAKHNLINTREPHINGEHPPRRRRENLTPAEAWARWREQREAERAFKAQQAREAKQHLRMARYRVAI